MERPDPNIKAGVPYEEFTIPKDVDTKYLDAVEKVRETDIKKVTRNEPSEVLDVEIRLREGNRHKGDEFVLDGEKTIIPQLSFLDVRRATREGLKIFDKTELGKRILYEKRRAMNKDEAIAMDSWEERQVLAELSDVEDIWLAWFALRDAKYSKITGDFSKDRCWIEYLPRNEIEEYITKIRRFNGMENPKTDTPSGEDDVKSFRDDEVGGGIPGGDTKH